MRPNLRFCIRMQLALVALLMVNSGAWGMDSKSSAVGWEVVYLVGGWEL